MIERTRSRVKTLLVDDEPLAIENLRAALGSHEDLEVAGVAADGPTAVRMIRSLDPDLVFLDVQMPGMDGFEVLRALGSAEPPAVVFVTAYDQHAVRAFEVHALDYLLKPFDDARFAECVRRAVRQVRAQQEGGARAALNALLLQMTPHDDAPPGRRYAERIAVREQSRISFVATADVDWFESAGNYVRIHTNGAQHLIRSTLLELLDNLDPRCFVRIHRSVIVNLSRITELEPWVAGDYFATLSTGEKLKVSRTYREDLLRPFS